MVNNMTVRWMMTCVVKDDLNSHLPFREATGMQTYCKYENRKETGGIFLRWTTTIKNCKNLEKGPTINIMLVSHYVDSP